MSGLVGAAMPVTIHCASEDGHVDLFDTSAAAAWPPPLNPLGAARDPLLPNNGFRTPWWPGGSGLALDGGLGDIIAPADAWTDGYPVSGCNGRFSWAGVTRDQYGSPLGNCTVRCFRTSTSELQAQVISESNGTFTITSPYNDAHFLTVHGLAGQVAGATIDSLVPT